MDIISKHFKDVFLTNFLKLGFLDAVLWLGIVRSFICHEDKKVFWVFIFDGVNTPIKLVKLSDVSQVKADAQRRINRGVFAFSK